VLDLAGEALRQAGRLGVQQVGERRCRFSSIATAAGDGYYEHGVLDHA
jgi:hypothetical protein